VSHATLHLTNANRTAMYSAPEALTGVVSAASDWWSVGVMVLEFLQGVHPLTGMNEQVVNFQLVSKGIVVPEDLPAKWGELLRGLLTRDHQKRWQGEQVSQWLQGRRGQATYYQGGAQEAHRHKPYQFGGKDHFTAKELAGALSADWVNGVKNFGRGFVAGWVRKELGSQDLAARLLDLQEDQGLTGDEKLTLALAEMDPELPGIWRGNVVNREWAACEPEGFKEVLWSQARRKLEGKTGWPMELAVRLDRLRGRKLSPDQLQGLERMALTESLELRVGRWVVTPDSLGREGRQAVGLLESDTPEEHEKLTGQRWLAQAAEDWRKYWPQVEALECGTSRERALPWVVGGRERVRERAQELLTRHAGSPHKALNALWERDELGTAECVALSAAEESWLETAEQRDARVAAESAVEVEDRVREGRRQEEERVRVEQLREAAEMRAQEALQVEAEERRFLAILRNSLMGAAIALVLGMSANQIHSAMAGRLAESRRLEWVGAGMRRAGMPEQTIRSVLTQGGGVLAWGYNDHGQTDVPGRLGEIVAVAAGDRHSLALRSGGKVVAWGDNSFGQTKLPWGLRGVVAISAGANHSLALRGDGSVVGWGRNDYGQTEVPRGLGRVVAVAAAGNHSLALREDGKVVAWGWNQYGQINVPQDLDGVMAIAGGMYHNLALRSDGSVVAWGSPGSAQAKVPEGLTGVVAIAARDYQSLALRSDGTPLVWGASLPMGLGGVVAIAAGNYHALAIRVDGVLIDWEGKPRPPSRLMISGSPWLPSITKPPQSTKAPGGLSGIAFIAAGADHGLAIQLK
jgi:hypothetical protein